MIRPHRYPKEIIGDDAELIKTYLISYQKSRGNWDDTASKISIDDREMLAAKFRECRANGYFNPHVEGGEIQWSVLVYPRIMKKYEPKLELTVEEMKREDVYGN